jgi:branched-chain amino acid aminotransferase
MVNKVWINGRLLDSKKAKVSIFDRGFMYGDGAFETMRAYAGVVFELDAHMSRLFSSLKALKIKLPYSKKYLKDAIYKSLRVNRLSGAYIKLIVTRGEGRFGIGYKDKFSSNVVIAAKNFDGYPEWMFDQGLSANIIGIQNEKSAISNMKTLNYLPYILARFDAKDMGFDEAILTNTKGRITEAATSNMFLVKGNNIITPSIESGVLPGITRAVVIRLARKLGFKVSERAVSRRKLLKADEVFLTNSLAEILPVTKIDLKRIGKGEVGDTTKLLRISYQKQVIREVSGII